MKTIKKNVSKIGVAWTKGSVEKDGAKIAEFRCDTVKTAKALLAKGFVKGSDIRSPWNGVGTFVGASNFGMVTTMIEDSVGVVINSFSGFGSSIIDLRHLLRHDFETFSQVSKNGTATDKARAENVKLFMETFQGKFDCENKLTFDVKVYESVTATGEEAGGYRLVDVDPVKANEVIQKLLRLNVENVKLAELLAVCEDMAAVTRQSAECTIDTYKKPVLIVIAGIPGLSALKKGVKYMSKDEMKLLVNWGNPVYEENVIVSPTNSVNLLVNGEHVVKRKGATRFDPIVLDDNGLPFTCYFDHHDLGGKNGESYQIDITNRNGELLYKELHLCDVNQRVRLQLFRQFAEWLQPIVDKYGDDVQRMLPQEIEKIREAVKKYNSFNGYNIGLLDAIRTIGEEYQTAHTASVEKQREKLADLNGKSKIVIRDEIAQEKAEGGEILEALANKARVTFDCAERILSAKSNTNVVISPADRVRIVWAVVIANATKNGITNWRSLGTLAQNLLGPEYMLWVLDAFKGQVEDDNGNVVDFDTLVPKYTRDKVYPIGLLADATAEELLSLDGVTVPFSAGYAVDEDGDAFMSAKTALDGDFVIKAEQDENGKVVLFATHNIQSLVVVPKGDPRKVVVRLTAAETGKTMEIVKAANNADTMFLTRGNKVAVYGDNGLETIGTYVTQKFRAATMVLNIDYDKDSVNVGVKGTVKFYKDYSYFNTRKDQWESSAFLIIDVDGPATPGEVANL